MIDNPPTQAALREHASDLRLHGLLAHWAEVMAQPEHARWVAEMSAWEGTERSRRSLERRLREAHIGRFKPLADFDWTWPKSIDRGTVEESMTLDFLKDASNVVLVGPNGVGKTMCACILDYLDLSTPELKDYAADLLDLIHKAGIRRVVFRHTVDEIKGIGAFCGARVGPGRCGGDNARHP